MGYQAAEAVYNGAQTLNCRLTGIQFENVLKTKRSSLLLETMELYKSKTLDELIRKSHMASVHMQEVGLMEGCYSIIEKDPKRKDGFILRFLMKEPKAITVGVKMGVTNTGNADGSVTASKQSIFGSAESADISYSKALRGGHNFNVNFVKPWLGWQSYRSTGVNVRRSCDLLNWNLTNLTENAINIQHANSAFDGLLSQLIRANIVWRFLQPTAKTAFPIREHAGHTTKFSLEHVLSYDKRDRPILPETGYIGRWTAEIAPFIGDSHFFRSEFFVQAAAKLPFGFFFNSSLQTQMLQNIGDRTLHVLDRLYLGGPLDVRGFKLNSIGPRVEECALGGAFSLATTAHLYYPLYPKNMFFAHAFASAGSVVSVRSRNWLNDALDSMRCSAGVGVTAIIRDIIRFELNYVVPVAFVPGDQCEPGLYFGAGARFL
ncbi:Omp85 domain-containing protein [Aphelenchoides besseyi]|nr:Omp85 domain-containing protein [Aphelenchoides besseyi]KAI6201296.1 Omp85 domain-containing protein [Aphelenchoides besseyi]